MRIVGHSTDIHEGQCTDPPAAPDQCQHFDRAGGVQPSPVAVVRKRRQHPPAPGVRQVVVDEPRRGTLAAEPGLLRLKRQSGGIERKAAGVVEIAGRVAEVHPAYEARVLLHDAVRRMDDRQSPGC